MNAVLIPCYNEALTIAKVVQDFRRELPEAEIYVYDNNSTDETAAIAQSEGAIVRQEYQQGKGNVVRRMFAEIEADVYILVDGDDTYPAEHVTEMIALLENRKLDMVYGDRLSKGIYTNENKRLFHNFGNNLVKWMINMLFHANVTDIMTGYRVFSKRFVKNYPVMGGGFELETEMTLHALDKRFAIAPYPIDYRDRPEGSISKLNTVPDGWRVLKTIAGIFKDYKPLMFFGMCSIVVAALGLLCGFPVISEYLHTGYIYHIPLSILAASLELFALNLLACGLILDTVVKNDKKNYELRLVGTPDTTSHVYAVAQSTREKKSSDFHKRSKHRSSESERYDSM